MVAKASVTKSGFEGEIRRGSGRAIPDAGPPLGRSVRQSGTHQKVVVSGVEEKFVQTDAISICLVLNRRAKTMRVVDFRAGATPAKRRQVQALAERERAEKIFTLVERDEVASWTKLGFAREGNVPGFYKRSDAFLMGAPLATLRATPMEADAPPPADDEEGSPREVPPLSAAHAFAEETLVTAKKLAKNERPLPKTKLARIDEADVKRPAAQALKAGRALTAFEPFGRDVSRDYYVATSRGGFELHASVESQVCFANGFLELLKAPSSEAERLGTTAALKSLCAHLTEEGTIGLFSLCPSDHTALATAFVQNGFRRTGLLRSHLVVGSERKDAIVFSKKLANPAGD